MLQMESQGKQIDLILKYKLNCTEIATHLGIHTGTFSEKINRKRGSKFTKPQLEKLTQYVKSYAKELSKDISSL